MSGRALIAAAALAGTAACAVGAGGDIALFEPEPTDGVQGAAVPASAGSALYAEKCGSCHDGSGLGMGTGLLARRYEGDLALLENRDNLTPELIELVVRSGVGNMPRLSRAEVSDAQLAAIAAYLTAPDEESAP